jgi:hypothetical protein
VHHGAFEGYELEPAGIFLRGEERSDSPIKFRSVKIYGPENLPTRLRNIKPGHQVMLIGNENISEDVLGRFLAKIAHGEAVAQLGIGSFIPFLTRAIRNERPMYLGYYVGGLPHFAPSDPGNRHSIRIALVTLPNVGRIVIARVRLFESMQYPAYEIAVGKATAATRQR